MSVMLNEKDYCLYSAAIEIAGAGTGSLRGDDTKRLLYCTVFDYILLGYCYFGRKKRFFAKSEYICRIAPK